MLPKHKTRHNSEITLLVIFVLEPTFILRLVKNEKPIKISALCNGPCGRHILSVSFLHPLPNSLQTLWSSSVLTQPPKPILLYFSSIDKFLQVNLLYGFAKFFIEGMLGCGLVLCPGFHTKLLQISFSLRHNLCEIHIYMRNLNFA